MVEPLDTKAWVLVPVEPTEEMLAAVPASHSASFQAIWSKICGDIYRTMLSASTSLPVVDGGAFTHVAKTKLEGLLADGWQINGYSIHKDDRLGLVTTGAFVGWYTNACEAMEAAESRVLSLEEEVKRLREALKPFARIADMEEKAAPATSVTVNVNRCRDARNALKVNGNGNG